MADQQRTRGGRRSRWWLLAALVLAVPAIYRSDLAFRYWSWKTLTKAELVAEAERYLAYHTDGGQACLYAVDCRSGRAALVLVEDLDAWDLAATRDIVWRRRFSEFCPGRTANIGLHVIPLSAQHKAPVTSVQTARWSFYHDRFLPRWSRFQGGAFSEAAWQPCTAPHAVARRQPRPVRRTRPLRRRISSVSVHIEGGGQVGERITAATRAARRRCAQRSSP